MVNSISSILARLNNYNDIYINAYRPLNVELAIKKKTEQLDSENRLTDKEKAKLSHLGHNFRIRRYNQNY